MLGLEFNQKSGQVGIGFVWFRLQAAGFTLRPPEHLSAQISKVATNLTHQPTQMSPIGTSFYKEKMKMAAPKYLSCDYTTGGFSQTI